MKVKTILTLRSWDGLAETITDPQNIEKVFDVGDKLNQDDFGGFVGPALVIRHPSLEIMAINDEAIEIKVNGLVTENPSGGINLNKPSVDSIFTISIGGKLKLISQSTDSGFSVVIHPTAIISK